MNIQTCYIKNNILTKSISSPSNWPLAGRYGQPSLQWSLSPGDVRTRRLCRWRWAPWSAPAGSTGSLLRGCRACLLWAGYSGPLNGAELRHEGGEGGRSAVEDIGTDMALWLCGLFYLLRVQTQWYVAKYCSWADIPYCPPVIPDQQKRWEMNKKIFFYQFIQ